MGQPKPTVVLGATYDHRAQEAASRHGVPLDVEDLACAMIRFENGATLVLEASWAAHIGEHEIMETRILGARGGLVHRNVGEGYDLEAEIYSEHAHTGSRGADLIDQRFHPPFPDERTSMYSLVESLVEDVPHPSTGEDALVAQEILDAIYASAESGEAVVLGQ